MRIKLYVVLAGLALTVAPIWAHHAFAAEFDGNKPVKLQGKVTKMEWINPHAWIHIDAKNADGTVRRAQRAAAARIHQSVSASRQRNSRERLASQGRLQPRQRERSHFRRWTEAVYRNFEHGGAAGGQREQVIYRVVIV
jgi:hypothetical protein